MRIIKRNFNENNLELLNEISYLTQMSDLVVLLTDNKQTKTTEFCCFTIAEDNGKFGCIKQEEQKLKFIYDNIKYYYENTSKDIPSQCGFILGSASGMSHRLKQDITIFFIFKE